MIPTFFGISLLLFAILNLAPGRPGAQGSADLGGSEIAGRFDGADVLLYSVPLDVLQASGTWRYAGGTLSLANGAFRVEDREQVDRFAPLIARDATLALPRLILPSIQVNMRGGRLPEPEDNGVSYLKLPINQF